MFIVFLGGFQGLVSLSISFFGYRLLSPPLPPLDLPAPVRAYDIPVLPEWFFPFLLVSLPLGFPPSSWPMALS